MLRRKTKHHEVILDGSKLVAAYNAWLKRENPKAKPLNFSDDLFLEPLVRDDRETQKLVAKKKELVPYPLPVGSAITYGTSGSVYINLRMEDEDGESFWDFYEIPYAAAKKILDDVHGSRIPANVRRSNAAGNSSLFITPYKSALCDSCDVLLKWTEVTRTSGEDNTPLAPATPTNHQGASE